MIYPRQFSFRKGHSTVDAYTLLTGEIMNAFREDFHFLGVFIDLKKAFNTVDHQIILRKLERIGVRGISLDWFISYLTERKQMVVYKNCASEPREILTGIPQGSLLGVILFQLHIDGIRSCLKFTNAILYVDDTTIYVFG